MKKERSFDAKKAADSVLKIIGVDVTKIPPEIRNAEIIIDDSPDSGKSRRKRRADID